LHADTGEHRSGDTAWCIPKRGGGEAFLLLLLEFQSGIAPRMALRVLVYAGLLWQHLEREKRLLPGGRLPPILPIVLYRGKSKWSAPLSLRPLIALPEGSPLWEWQPDMCYCVIDERRFDEADLAQREGLLPLVFRVETAVEPDQLVVVKAAARAWFAANPVPETLRLLFIELLRAAMEPLAPGMPVPDDLWESETVLAEDVEAWKQKYIEKGRQEGVEIGERKGEAAALFRLLERRFGALPEWVKERVTAADRGALEGWLVRVLEAESLDGVFD